MSKLLLPKKTDSKKIRRMLLVIFAFVNFYLISYAIDPYSTYWKSYFDRNLGQLFTEWSVSFVFCLLISEFSILIHSRLNRSLPWTSRPMSRMFSEMFLNLLVVVVLILINIVFASYLFDEVITDTLTIDEKRGLMQWLVVSVAISFMIISINTGSYLITNWMETETQMGEHKLQAAQLKQASVVAELNALKLQLDPHFIFNNLSVLSELILKDQRLGYEYSENFAKVYRFLLLNSKKNMISLEEELKFLQAYIFLTSHRVGEGVWFGIDISEESKKLYLPPLTLQLLIENALKHNKTSKSDPLKIQIYNLSDDVLVVKNNLSLIGNPENSNSTGIGLQNIISRFNLLGKRPPQIVSEPDSFKVIVYLMEYDK